MRGFRGRAVAWTGYIVAMDTRTLAHGSGRIERGACGVADSGGAAGGGALGSWAWCAVARR